MPLASSKQLPMMSLLHYLMLTLFHSRFLLPVPKLAHRLYNAAASSPSRPREGDSLAINQLLGLQHLSALSFIAFSLLSYGRHSRSYTSTPEVSRNSSEKLNGIVARFQIGILHEKLSIPVAFKSLLHDFRFGTFNNNDKYVILLAVVAIYTD